MIAASGTVAIKANGIDVVKEINYAGQWKIRVGRWQEDADGNKGNLMGVKGRKGIRRNAEGLVGWRELHIAKS